MNSPDIIENTQEVQCASALCALAQAANLVDRLASHGQIPVSTYELMRASLFKFNVELVQDIYQLENTEGNTSYTSNPLSQNLSTGIRVCKQIFEEGQPQEYPHTIRYTMALIQLEKHFRKSPQMQSQVRESLMKLNEQKNQSETFNLDRAISDLYLETLAKLPFRIQVLGKMQHLQNNENEHKVRVLLFSGIRATMLWQQNGGRRWHFVLKKGSIIRGLNSIK
jgi:high frequency lysogenization protein